MSNSFGGPDAPTNLVQVSPSSWEICMPTRLELVITAYNVCKPASFKSAEMAYSLRCPPRPTKSLLFPERFEKLSPPSLETHVWLL